MPSRSQPPPALKGVAEAIKSSESSFAQSHIQGDPLKFSASTTFQLGPCEHDGPNTPMRQSTHRTGVPLTLARHVKAQLKNELFDGDKCLVEADVSPADIYRNFKALNKINMDAYLRKTDLYDTVAKRWTNIPAKGPEDGLYQPFTDIINEILDVASVTYASAEDTHNTLLSSREEHQMKFVDEKDKEINGKTSPDICIMGEGRRFQDEAHVKKAENNPDGGPSYSFCIAPVELKTESMLANVGLTNVLLQIAVYVRQCFNHQPNRHFACAILATEKNFRLMVFDRSGGMKTGSFSIHQEPKAFIRVILGITSIHDKELTCFDDAMNWLPCSSCDVQYIDMRMTSCYEVARDDHPKRSLKMLLNGRPFARRAIIGRGTRCWSGVLMDGESRVDVVVKDSWRSKGRVEEWVLLKKVAKFDGVGKMLFYCEATKKDNISYFRSLIFGLDLTEPPPIDRTFSRVVLEAYGPPIHYFKSPLQLLQALRDAVAGHRFMWKAGILHRDVSIYNVLLGRENATAGNLGVLIDLDMAIEVSNYKKNAESRTGTRAFQSAMVVSPYVAGKPRAPQDHLDDLESFLYVLLWICMLFVTPKRMRTTTLDSAVNQMEDALDKTCHNSKYILLCHPTAEITAWFGKNPIFRTLLRDLAAFIKAKVDDKKELIETDQAFPNLMQVHATVGTQDHDIFITHLDKAIVALNLDANRGPDPSLYLQDTGATLIDLDDDDENYPSGQEIGGRTTQGRSKRAASDGGENQGTQKRANTGNTQNDAADEGAVDEDAAAATDGVSRLQLSD